jgi:hypothetical protein
MESYQEDPANKNQVFLKVKKRHSKKKAVNKNNFLK